MFTSQQCQDGCLVPIRSATVVAAVNNPVQTMLGTISEWPLPSQSVRFHRKSRMKTSPTVAAVDSLLLAQLPSLPNFAEQLQQH
jgi:hypothetical protein